MARTTIAPIDPRQPCIVGTARRTWHPDGDAAPEPLDMWVEVARAAGADARGDGDPLRAVDHLGLVHCQSWAYDHPAGRLADELRLEPGAREESILAGTAPQRLLDQAALRMLCGDASVALVVGGEALATRKHFDRSGELPPWRHTHASPPVLPIDLDEWYLPTEMAHGVMPAWLTFALLEQARWAERGGTVADRHDLARIMGRLNEVAAANPDAWFRQPRSATELTTAADDNRVVAWPYTKRMTAFMDVDMAAANLMVTHAVADDWGVPHDQRVYLRGWGFARDEVHVAERQELGASPGMRAATASALAAAAMDVDDIDVFDLYSCFGSAVGFAQDALGLDPRDPRPISVTGGLPYHGGPSSNYMGHSTSHMVDLLRANPDQVAMTTGVGMHMTKHVAAIWANQPGPLRRSPDDGAQTWNDEQHAPGRRVLEHHDGPALMMAATVVHEAPSTPEHVLAICETDDGARCYAKSTDSDAIRSVITDSWAGQKATISAGPNGTNHLSL